MYIYIHIYLIISSSIYRNVEEKKNRKRRSKGFHKRDPYDMSITHKVRDSSLRGYWVSL